MPKKSTKKTTAANAPPTRCSTRKAHSSVSKATQSDASGVASQITKTDVPVPTPTHARPRPRARPPPASDTVLAPAVEHVSAPASAPAAAPIPAPAAAPVPTAAALTPLVISVPQAVLARPVAKLTEAEMNEVEQSEMEADPLANEADDGIKIGEHNEPRGLNEIDELDELDEFDDSNNDFEMLDDKSSVASTVAGDSDLGKLNSSPGQAADAVTAPRLPSPPHRLPLIRIRPQPPPLKLTSSESEIEPLPPPVVLTNPQTKKSTQSSTKTTQKKLDLDTKESVGKGKKGTATKHVPDLEHTIDTSDLIVTPTFLCFVQAEEGLKQHELHPGIEFNFFSFQMSKVLGERRLLTNESEFQRMMDEINKHYNSQISTIRSQRLKEAAAAHNASLRGCAHTPKAPKSIPPLNLTFYNKTVTEKSSSKKQSKAKEETKPVVKSLTVRMSRARDEIKKKGCDECGKTCVLVPQANGRPQHKPLESQHLDLWAEHGARGLCTLSRPPDPLVVALANAEPSHHPKDEKPVSRPADPRPTSPLKASLTHNPTQSRPPYPIHQPQHSFVPPFASPFAPLLGPSPKYAPPYFLSPPNPYHMMMSYG
ncbi:hypothetical protein FRC09_009240 [Ceratobasidium sp. 395]|nr:hypothetical protein FRC09_009240 [Ceratobasidium sp. 395]